MRHVTHVLVREWERAILGAALLVLACFCLVWLHAPHDTPDQMADSAGHGRPSLLAPGALAFMTADQGGSGESDLQGLFSFSYMSEPRAAKVADPPAPPEVPPQPEPPGNPEDGGTTDGGGGAHKPPRSLLDTQFRTVRYLGIYTATTGRQLAAVEIGNPKTGRSQTRFWDAGEATDGVQLEEFSGDALRFLAPGGQGGTVARGATVTIQLQ